MHVSHPRDTKLGVEWTDGTHTLRNANTPDAYIVIYASPRTLVHTTKHKKSRGGGGPVGLTQAPHKHPLAIKLSDPPPSFHVVVWVVEPLLFLPKVREGIHFLFAGVLVFVTAMLM